MVSSAAPNWSLMMNHKNLAKETVHWYGLYIYKRHLKDASEVQMAYKLRMRCITLFT